MKNKENELFEDKLNNFLKNHNGELDSDLYASMLKMHISDVVFDSYINTKSRLSLILITIQLFVVIIGLLLAILGFSLFGYIASNIVIVILIVVLINGRISTKEWHRAQKRLETTNKLIDELVKKCEDN